LFTFLGEKKGTDEKHGHQEQKEDKRFEKPS
jgi:hypothetical protein